MKIAYIIQYFGSPDNSYASGRSWDFATYWASKGHEVWVICSDAYFLDKQRRDDLMGIQNLHVTVIPQPYSNSFSIIHRLFAFLGFTVKALLYLINNPTRYDTVYASSTPLTVGLIGYIQKRFTRKPWIFELRDLWPDFPIQAIPIKQKWIQNLLFSFEAMLYKSASALVCLSPLSLQQLHKEKNQPLYKLHFFPNGYSEASKQSLERPLPDTAKRIVLYEGALGKANGIPWLLTYFTHLFTLSDSITVVIAGFGSEESTCRKWRNSLPIEKQQSVHLLGTISRNNISNWVQRADISLVTFSDWPILQTNSPNKLFDAIGFGIPVITNTTGWIATMAEQSGGFFEKDPKKAAEKTLLNFPEKKNTAKNNFSAFSRYSMAEKMLKIFENCG